MNRATSTSASASARRVALCMALVVTAACGSRTALRLTDAALDAPVAPVDARTVPDANDAPLEERCANGIDDDGDGQIDEGCPTCFSALASPWRMHRAQGPVCFGRSFSDHGVPEEYAFARIPPEDDPQWRPLDRPRVDFSERSVLCDRPCMCRDGGEFTYFETSLFLPSEFRVERFEVSATVVDDGVRVTLFNDRYPEGTTDPRAYSGLSSEGFSIDLARDLAPGRNRLVLTHLDDCCSERHLQGVALTLNGGVLTQCR